jgi:putative oxidoreductase
MTIRTHFTPKAIDYAALNHVPMPSLLVPLAGVIAFAGGLSIFLGYKAKAGAWLIVIFLIPVTFFMHAFWKETDAMQMQMQISNFMKNTALIGAALLITYFGAGPLSFDSRNKFSE